jgi:16S rRNA pseudouridine516 synthase
VTVNGVAVRSGDEKVDPAASAICVDGREIRHAKFRYFIMNKPLGVITATEDIEQKTVIDLLPPELGRLGLFPVGRLARTPRGFLS